MIIQVEELKKCYGATRAVDGVSFHVDEGEVFGMLGPNGAGKTTSLEIVEGLRVADSGRVTVLGLDISRDLDKIRQRIGIQLQAPALLPLLNVEELLYTFAGFYKRSLPVDAILDMLALGESRKVLIKHLSGGQQQRLSVGMALISDPDIAFLDEPTTGLDPQARRALWSVVEETRKRGKTVCLTTHYMEEAERLCDRVAIMDHGKIIALGKPRDLTKEHFSERAIQFETEKPPAAEALQALPGATRAHVNSGEVVLYSSDVTATLAALLQPDSDGRVASVKDLHVREATLEDVFLKLTGRRIRE